LAAAVSGTRKITDAFEAQTSTPLLPEGSTIAGRYRVEALLGAGGTAQVYRVRDASSGQELALKRAAPRGVHTVAQRQSFEREFYTLRQLSHPAIVAVYDYGIDGVPFYTMELLTGDDFTTASPLPWRAAVSTMLPVLSALAVLHSRRLIHRDVSASNVRRTREGAPKLIDFGAMSELGMARQLVGTVPYVPPEAVNQQPLDQRVDLYAVGALLYRLLTGQDAYPAATFPELRELWRVPVPSVREWISGVPEPLNQLVMELLALDPIARPPTAADVIERLMVIGGITLHESSAVQQAYLTTPKLVGRDAPLEQVRVHVQSVRRGLGGVLAIEGAPGVGRSRMLDACVLDAKLAGLVVLRADAADGSDFAVARTLLEQLSAALPDASLGSPPELELLEQPDRAPGGRAQLQAAMRERLLQLAGRHGLLLAIDDLQLADEPSSALLALLASSAPHYPLSLCVTLASDGRRPSAKATALILAHAQRLALPPLAAEDSEALLCSVFGDVPGVRLLADRLHRLSEGNPRALMELGQHLVTHHVVRYEGGAWRIPSRVDPGDLPERVQQALQLRLDALGPDARALAEALALCQGVPFSHAELSTIAELPDRARLHAELDELVAAGVVRAHSDVYAFQQSSWVDSIRHGMSEARSEQLHERLAGVLTARGDQPLQAAAHLLSAGDEARALDAIVALSLSWVQRDQSQTQSARFMQMAMSDAFVETLQTGLLLFETHARPRRERYVVQLALLFAAMHGRLAIMKRHLDDTAGQLSLDSGLSDYHELSAGLDPALRLRRALESARVRYDSTPPAQRVFAPVDALKYLTRLIHNATALAGAQHDSGLLTTLPSLEPLLPLSPALDVARQNVEAVRLMLAGRHLAALERFERMIARLDEPDRAGHDPTLHKYVRLALVYVAGMCAAGLGLESAMGWAKQLEGDPLHELNALRIRATYDLARGAAQAAEECRRRLELLEIQNAPTQFFQGYDVFRYLPSYAAADDLSNVKRALDTTAELAARSPGWVPVRHYAAGEYARIRGDNATALVCFQRALELTGAGRHPVWAHAAEQTLYVLIALGRASEAESYGRAWAEAWELDELIGGVGVAFAAVEAELGRTAVALQRLDSIITRWRDRGLHGVALGRAYELAARYARATGEHARYEAYLEGCREEYTFGGTPALIAKYQRLCQ
jgi:hypothetical protein